ncbi:MAG: serine/threonine-protein kinase [Gemmatimonadetes bacterium]|nr:serine/threonine-protein kinase [Gemmatimonadota bacterium]
MSDLTARLTSALAERYLIERELGQGGMATVFLAQDVKHHRQVAVKVLKPELAAVIGAERFLQEIRVTAHLQHPHILPLFDSGEADSFLFYVMPYLEGESLRDRLNREKQLPIEDAVQLTIEVLAALSYAHSRGVIHRDIKPENILMTGGAAVVADFGIARAITAAGAERLTETGLSLGTPQYMSPEQATAERELDGRSDIYSLGCVLYEMLAGEPPHTGPTTQSVIAKVLTDRPRQVSTLRETVPPSLEAAVHKALAKLPADRFQTAQQLAEALTRPGISAAVAGEPAAATPGREKGAVGWIRHNRLVATLSVVTVLSVSAAVWLWLRPAPVPQASVVRFTFTPPIGSQLGRAGPGNIVAVSPDGDRLVYVGRGTTSAASHLYLRAMDRLDITPIPSPDEPAGPTFSPDGRWVAFFAGASSAPGRRTLFKVSIAGGAPVTVCQSPSPINGVAWGDRGLIVFSTDGGGVYAVDASGEEPRALVPAGADQQFAVWPGGFLPGGRIVLATRGESGRSEIVAVDVETGSVQPLVADASRASYVNSGYIVYQQGDAVMAASFEPRRGNLMSPAIQLADGVQEAAVSASGAVVYLGTGSSQRNLVIVNRQGHVDVLPAGTLSFRGPVVAPDGRRVVFFDGGNNGDVWIYDLVRGTLGRLSFSGGSEYAAWSPDGGKVLFSAPSAERGQDIFWVPADASAPAAVLLSLAGPQWEAILTPDGRRLIYRENNSSTARDIFVVPLDSLQAARPLAATRYQERAMALSPDGRWLAYVSDESGVDEVYVRPLDGPAARHQVSNGGGTEPRWARNGRELFFRTEGDSLFSVSVEPGLVFRPGARRLVFVLRAIRDAFHANYDVFPDGRFVFVREAAGEGQGTASFTVVLNEFDRIARERRQR